MQNYNASVGSEDELVYNYLTEKSLQITFEIWDNPEVKWHSYDILLVKSPWDYFDKIDAFYAWLKFIQAAKIPMLNPADVILWNADKLYLKDVEKAGINIVPTIWLDKGNAFDATSVFAALESDRIIFKPRISGGAKNTWLLNLNLDHQKIGEINTLLKSEDYMAQPFLEEVATKGEWSFIFFNGKFSHCVLKTAKAGDFRVQHFLGGAIHTMQAPDHLLQKAQEIADKFTSKCMYARVDGVEVDGELLLMELELTEPFLFLFTQKNALQNYYEAFMFSSKKAIVKNAQ